ncbi:MAG: argininosuccinate lyase [Planctomyces sp.]|nr:argininosuccinate lyase [Planctomyces sp.]MBA4120626.1 argininosuccinate lyase [Isosphaera sp.]
MALWGGRFESAADPLFRAFNDSLAFDARLVQQDVRGSIAWAAALQRAGVLSAGEADKLASTLRAIGEFAASNPRAVLDSGEEDVHSWVEAELVRRAGEVGKKLHTGRSRNDQVATDLRLFALDRTQELLGALTAARRSLVALAQRELDTPVPGYTHLQRGQPVLLAHWALAYFEMLGRDAERFVDAGTRAAVSPLGCGALAGTAYPIDRAALARELGLGQPAANSLDAVSDRDFALEILGACTITAVHLSRLAEDLILYASAEFGFVRLDDSVTSGSSLMPQKKNPDALELMRGKVGRVLGAFTALAATLKGLPLAYNKDLQEDKEGLFDATDHLLMCLLVLPRVLDTMTVDRARARAAADDGFSAATDLADYLVRKGVPFRDAHHVAGRIVRLALGLGVPLHGLSLEQMRSVEERIEGDVFAELTLEAVLAKRDAIGGTSPRRVRQAIQIAQQDLPDA